MRAPGRRVLRYGAIVRGGQRGRTGDFAGFRVQHGRPVARRTAISPAATKSTAAQNGGHHRVVATNPGAVLPQVLEAVPDQAGHHEPGRCRHQSGDDHARGCHSRLDGDDVPASVGDGQADVDGDDQG
jgi:hypothetical protein